MKITNYKEIPDYEDISPFLKLKRLQIDWITMYLPDRCALRECVEIIQTTFSGTQEKKLNQ